MIFSNEDNFYGSECMLSFLLRKNQLEYIEMYSGTNIV